MQTSSHLCYQTLPPTPTKAAPLSYPRQSPTPSHVRISRQLHSRCIWNSCTMCGLIGAALLSSGAIITKAMSDRISVFQVAVVRSLLTIPVMLPLGYYQSGMILGPLDNLKWTFFRGFFATCGFLFGVVSAVFLPISESALVVHTYPGALPFSTLQRRC